MSEKLIATTTLEMMAGFRLPENLMLTALDSVIEEYNSVDRTKRYEIQTDYSEAYKLVIDRMITVSPIDPVFEREVARQILKLLEVIALKRKEDFKKINQMKSAPHAFDLSALVNIDVSSGLDVGELLDDDDFDDDDDDDNDLESDTSVDDYDYDYDDDDFDR